MNIAEQTGAVWSNSWIVTMMHHGVLGEVLFLACVAQ